MKGRRRGADLEKALLDAAWIELSERGYTGLTMEGVAARAGTSRPVIARRWGGKAELAIAAIGRQIDKHPLDVADCGDLRTELLDFLEQLSKRTQWIAATFTLFASVHFQETGATPQDLQSILRTGRKDTLQTILDRAVKRGEIDPEKLIPPVATLLSDLLRHHAVMTFSPPPPTLRKAWVDSIFLPLVKTGGG